MLGLAEKLERRRELANAKIGVFWDVCDFPVPDIVSFSKNLRSALLNAGYHGAMSITAYGDDDKEAQQYKDAGITFVSRGSKLARIYKMLVDIQLSELDNRPTTGPTNMMVISKNLVPEHEDDDGVTFCHHMTHLHSGGSNVLLALPDDYKIQDMPSLNSIWYWSDLFSGGNPIDDTVFLISWTSQDQHQDQDA